MAWTQQGLATVAESAQKCRDRATCQRKCQRGAPEMYGGSSKKTYEDKDIPIVRVFALARRRVSVVVDCVNSGIQAKVEPVGH